MKEWGDLRNGPLQRLRSASMKPLAPESATELASLTERMDYLAQLVSEMPDRELTPIQRSLLRAIARELLRRVNR